MWTLSWLRRPDAHRWNDFGTMQCDSNFGSHPKPLPERLNTERHFAESLTSRAVSLRWNGHSEPHLGWFCSRSNWYPVHPHRTNNHHPFPLSLVEYWPRRRFLEYRENSKIRIDAAVSGIKSRLQVDNFYTKHSERTLVWTNKVGS